MSLMSSLQVDSKFRSFLDSFKELMADREDNDIIELTIKRYFGSAYNELINDRYFVYHFICAFVGECLIPEESVNGFALNETQLSERSKLLRKFVHNYIEYQLNLVLVLCQIKIDLNLSNQLFDGLIRSLHINGVVSKDAFNHWFKCNQNFERRVIAITNAIQLLDWTREAREEHFYDTNFVDMD